MRGGGEVADSSSETQRKLTTIFSADVQDYTRLMGVDEEGTLETLKRYRDRMSRLIEAHGGRVVNTWGDGLIAEFPSVVEAVRAAVDVQNELAGLNAARPADGRMLFRIGINLGDVIVEGSDIYGDGVNIAARLQAQAPAGGVVISNTVYDQVRNKVAVGFDFLGPLNVKNVAEAVPSYAVRIGDGAGDAAEYARAAGAPSGAAAQSTRPGPLSGERLGPLAGVLPGQNAGQSPDRRRNLAVLGVIAAALVVINTLTWHGVFWAAWPLLALAYVAAMRWAHLQERYDARLVALAISALGLIGINLLSWHGTFWAIWPLLAIAVVGGLRWARRG
ncbi:adenylate/guanylate cyclase domain-containing protein [Rhizobium sp. S163]|uniref:adenylate/guanylate cyclase domain-containing protein n=1 Tax=Rhizobium sp. S163 TaxID=3055039 RepID=UPI0025A931DE|nr:adenylate/guanylate cyclase domain-containing protein [Rhizobium sp. S163]MDM9648825.1 adenylate/guanylate cyclase domain-containing protein [Rhizobium sp. S163]